MTRSALVAGSARATGTVHAATRAKPWAYAFRKSMARAYCSACRARPGRRLPPTGSVGEQHRGHEPGRGLDEVVGGDVRPGVDGAQADLVEPSDHAERL